MKTSSSTSRVAIAAVLAPVATLAAEQPCFVYHDSRDLTGFIDGTENPPVEAGARRRRSCPTASPAPGGAFVLAQKWVHDLERVPRAGPRGDQEGTIGRTKPDSVELDDKPPDRAHRPRASSRRTARSSRSTAAACPYGRVGELGLYFLAFSADPSRFTKMLHRMFGLSGDGLHDHLTDFTRR